MWAGVVSPWATLIMETPPGGHWSDHAPTASGRKSAWEIPSWGCRPSCLGDGREMSSWRKVPPWWQIPSINIPPGGYMPKGRRFSPWWQMATWGEVPSRGQITPRGRWAFSQRGGITAGRRQTGTEVKGGWAVFWKESQVFIHRARHIQTFFVIFTQSPLKELLVFSHLGLSSFLIGCHELGDLNTGQTTEISEKRLFGDRGQRLWCEFLWSDCSDGERGDGTWLWACASGPCLRRWITIILVIIILIFINFITILFSTLWVISVRELVLCHYFWHANLFWCSLDLLSGVWKKYNNIFSTNFNRLINIVWSVLIANCVYFIPEYQLA